MFRNITLEMSLKPFQQTDTASIRAIVQQVYRQWHPLLKNREVISILLWVGDGSELLDYPGDLDRPFEWAYHQGTANQPLATESDPLNLGLHSKRRLYLQTPPTMTYRILREIISLFKEEGGRQFPGSRIRVGETFDIGPEFAISDFKYRRHPEICSGQKMGRHGFLNSNGVLHQDTFPYAGYPDGIPEGTPFGTFLGRQTQIFLTEMGFDYLWLSNGVGFSADPWRSEGVIYDGNEFHTEQLAPTKEKVFSFWKLFRAECPDFPLETRGTNFSAGIDYATDAVGLYDIYRADLNILPPPNSPWAALNGNFGLELMGHMSRNCELPARDYLFRFYLHDPWWVNSPWYDRYNGQPHDIYLPMAVSRIDEAGQIHLPSQMNILTIDNSFGQMPDACVNESIPHILKAEKDSPDDISDFVWAYPLREYTTSTSEDDLRQMIAGDWFICRAINHGLPLNTVVSCDNFLRHDPSLYLNSVLITPVPQAGSAFEQAILQYARKGGKVLFYGSVDTASAEFRSLFQLTLGSGISGPVSVELKAYPDIHRDGQYPSLLNFREALNGGALNTLATASAGLKAAGYALSAAYQNAIWYRAPIGGHDNPYSLSHTTPDDDQEYLRGEVLLRSLLARYGYQIHFDKPTALSATPILTLHRSDNAEMLAVYNPNTAVTTALRFPLGAPLLLGYEAELKEGCACYRFPRAVHAECRVFVEQASGVVSAIECAPVSRLYRRRIVVSGLENATVRFFGERYCAGHEHAVLNSQADDWHDQDDFDWESVHHPVYGVYYEARGVTGTLALEMPYPEYV